MNDLSLVGIVGSLRSESMTRSVFEAARDLVPDGVTLTEVDIADVPLFHGDVEAAGDPPSVTAMKRAVARADGLLIFTPEYNRSVPAVTKNAVDWLSRPYGSGPLVGKPVGIVAATPGRHTAEGVRDHLATAVSSNTHLLFVETLGLGGMTRAITDRQVTDAASRAELTGWIERFVQHARSEEKESV